MTNLSAYKLPRMAPPDRLCQHWGMIVTPLEGRVRQLYREAKFAEGKQLTRVLADLKVAVHEHMRIIQTAVAASVPRKYSSPDTAVCQNPPAARRQRRG